MENDALELIPVRMLNEYVYCPRLAYLVWIQAEWSDNQDTEAGHHAHRRVDKTSGTLPNTDDSAPTSEVIHARALVLSDEDYGIIAKLDLIEGEGKHVTPVDYKKGKRPHVQSGVYDPERVQLCAQGLLLRKHGFKVDAGYIYFVASKERVRVEFNHELEQLTLKVINEIRRLISLKAPPAPLEDSPKCPRCSLVSICLPDEVNWFRKLEKSPRPIVVHTEEKIPVHIQAPFGNIKKSGDVLEIEANQDKYKIRLDEIEHLALYGNIHLTTPTLQTLMRKGIPVSWHTQAGWFYGTAQGLAQKNVYLRIHQFRTAFDDQKSLYIAHSLIKAKILNSRTLLRRNQHSDCTISDTLKNLRALAEQATHVSCLNTLFGIEGQAAKLYFELFNHMITPENQSLGFDFKKRNRRPPRDPVNALLSFAYSILTRTWTSTLQSVGFDPYVGFMHQPRAGKPALALDMMEPFRPLLADSAVITAINNCEVDESSFVYHGDQCGLTIKGRKAFLKTIERRLNQQITHPYFGYKLTYRKLLELEARLLGRYLSGEIEHYQCFTTR
ncbi:CRISPR-associated endonuclease Cas1 [Vibrio sp. PID23_8]|uniref:CRISPR-associated endonuclease Cas4g/Cas1g n=1 Tax=Vibrio sp. PID23_8 TaxID=1583767 RepID=UPI000EDF598F|nr:CRISPR-associated endonuclease Cas1 [Vibrio sp. PID23_8]RIZ56027.1 CRISPR-associated protein Cas4 [Vibrio sp. PID23_8]